MRCLICPDFEGWKIHKQGIWGCKLSCVLIRCTLEQRHLIEQSTCYVNKNVIISDLNMFQRSVLVYVAVSLVLMCSMKLPWSPVKGLKSRVP